MQEALPQRSMQAVPHTVWEVLLNEIPQWLGPASINYPTAPLKQWFRASRAMRASALRGCKRVHLHLDDFEDLECSSMGFTLDMEHVYASGLSCLPLDKIKVKPSLRLKVGRHSTAEFEAARIALANSPQVQQDLTELVLDATDDCPASCVVKSLALFTPCTKLRKVTLWMDLTPKRLSTIASALSRWPDLKFRYEQRGLFREDLLPVVLSILPTNVITLVFKRMLTVAELGILCRSACRTIRVEYVEYLAGRWLTHAHILSAHFTRYV